MHNRTTEEQARINRGRANNGKISQVEDTSSLDDDYDVNIRLAGSGVVYDSDNQRTGALVSVVTGAMTGAFAVWLGHEK